MKTLRVEMPEVRDCSAKSCAYNTSGACHAKAITVGNSATPGCATFFEVNAHVGNVQLQAGVGACKVVGCRFNKDFECTAESISVGVAGNGVRCMTFQPAQQSPGTGQNATA
jgi:hypothetical protein